MEYGRLVVLGYSSYRVASVQTPSRTTTAPPRSQSFGLGIASSNVDSAANAATTTTTHSSRNNSSSSSNSSSNSNGNYSSSKKALGQLWEPIGDQNAQYVLERRKRANGVSLRCFHHFRSTAAATAGSKSDTQLLPPSTSPAHARTKDIEAVTRRMMHVIHDQRAATAPSSASRSASHSSNAPFLLCVPMSGSDVHASVTEYALDATRDMFQIGRLPCRQNDFVIPGPRVGASGTISRFAARIVCNRTAPFECRVFAGGFDAQRRMTTAGHALKFCQRCATWFNRLPLDHSCVLLRSESDSDSGFSQSNQMLETCNDDLEHVERAITDASDVPIDGVTKNGVRVWLPAHREWFEVSVNGNLYAIANRSATSATSSSSRHAVRHSTFNRPATGASGIPPILTDGAIIDLGGVQLQFQTSHRSGTNQQHQQLTAASIADQLERLNVQCPVQLHALRFPRGDAAADAAVDPLETPHVFPACGHVFGFDARIAAAQLCPLCRHPGLLVPLVLTDTSQLQTAAERTAIPECVLNPCGHAISRALAVHFAKLLMPNGRAICPFCAVHLHPTTPFSRLFLYSDDVDTDVR